MQRSLAPQPCREQMDIMVPRSPSVGRARLQPRRHSSSSASGCCCTGGDCSPTARRLNSADALPTILGPDRSRLSTRHQG